MERYGHTQAMEGTPADLVAEWSSPAGETGLEEPMCQLGFGAGAESYPERPDEDDCIHYLMTGFCRYGNRCRFNHPRDLSSAVGAMRVSGGEYPERVGQPVCQHYMKTGMCKFGPSCKYHHPKQGGGSASPVALNISGYPLRPGEKECSYYVRTGQCRFGVTCKFHHPQPAGIHVPPQSPGPLPAPAMYPTVQSSSIPSSQQYEVVGSNWPVARPALLPGSYLPGTYGPVLLSTGMFPFPGWSPYPAAASPMASPSTQPTLGVGPVYGMTQLSPTAPAYTGPYLSMASSAGPSGNNQKGHAFPERPGQAECRHYMETGDCKYGSSCRYHHPPQWSAPKSNFVLSSMGLPLRPGAPLCSYYEQNGVCKFGPSCKFDHPVGTLSHSPSASSLADMPVAPYPVGSSICTPAPSSSSSELRAELISGSNKDALSTRMPSMCSSSSSVGYIFSPSGPIPHSGAQQSGHGTASSTGSGSTGHGGEVHSSS